MIDPKEQLTVHFLDAPDLNAKVTNCTRQFIALFIETRVSHIIQHLLSPLSQGG
ncbi:MAG: hypothetical protein R3B95_05825 [Nitrospirales bacterium]|nr:hypothetical protein [Nitrospirales bacterium]